MLPCFKDSAGHEWRFTPSLGLFDTILEATGVDLIPDGNDVSAVMALPTNRRKLAEVLWAAVQSQAGSITQKDFNEKLDGDALTSGWGALLDGIVFFIPSQRREEVKAAIDLQGVALEKSVAATVETLRSQATDQAIQEAVQKAQKQMEADLPRALGIGVTSSLGS